MINSSMLIYQSDDGLIKIDTKFENETIWLTLDQMSELFQRNKSTISRHIKNIYDDGELTPESTVAKFATVQNEGAREVTRMVEYYDLDKIISAGYRVKSKQGITFRRWSSSILKDYILKGYVTNEKKLESLNRNVEIWPRISLLH